MRCYCNSDLWTSSEGKPVAANYGTQKANKLFTILLNCWTTLNPLAKLSLRSFKLNSLVFQYFVSFRLSYQRTLLYWLPFERFQCIKGKCLKDNGNRSILNKIPTSLPSQFLNTATLLYTARTNIHQLSFLSVQNSRDFQTTPYKLQQR